MNQERISTQFTLSSHFIEIDGNQIHYVETGQGRPILFLHGVPTSSYIWRNVMPHVATLGRCIALDLIGFGRSAKPAITYSITDHIYYVEQFIKQLNLQNLVLVMHGWGSVIGLDYAMRHQTNCNGLAFYEAFINPNTVDEISLPYQETLQATQNAGITLEADQNGLAFVDLVLPQSTMASLSSEIMTYYREPFAQAGSALPIAQYIKELPNGSGQSPADVIITQYSKQLAQSPLPKLMLYSVPGLITSFASAIWAKENLPHLEMIDLGEELHMAQESCPAVMGESLSVWLQSIEQIKR
jgi:haloalkane dehalogenase